MEKFDNPSAPLRNTIMVGDVPETKKFFAELFGVVRNSQLFNQLVGFKINGEPKTFGGDYIFFAGNDEKWDNRFEGDILQWVPKDGTGRTIDEDIAFQIACNADGHTTYYFIKDGGTKDGAPTYRFMGGYKFSPDITRYGKVSSAIRVTDTLVVTPATAWYASGKGAIVWRNPTTGEIM